MLPEKTSITVKQLRDILAKYPNDMMVVKTHLRGMETTYHDILQVNQETITDVVYEKEEKVVAIF